MYKITIKGKDGKSKDRPKLRESDILVYQRRGMEKSQARNKEQSEILKM